MSNSVRPHSRQSTRLPHPWDSPGKNTGVGCHFLLQCMKVKSESEVTQSCPTFTTPWTAAYQALLSMEFSRQEYWSGLPLPSPLVGLQIFKYFSNSWINSPDTMQGPYIPGLSSRTPLTQLLHNPKTKRLIPGAVRAFQGMLPFLF